MTQVTDQAVPGAVVRKAHAHADEEDTSDGWVDAGRDTQEASDTDDLIDVGATTVNADISSPPKASIETTRTAHTPEAPSSARLVPSNNPFLRSKSDDVTARAHPRPQEEEHEAAWAELIPKTSFTPDSASRTLVESPAQQPNAGTTPYRRGSKPTGKAPERTVPVEAQVAASPAGSLPVQPSRTSTAASSHFPPPPPRHKTYTIKHVRWLDHKAGDSVRTTPVLMQNLNGPCPLLALVNALTMSTLSPSSSSLFETLSTREQVSLNLLLNAVIEELMSGRSSNVAELPDMVELYDFLMALHTGMNVNPAFVQAHDTPDLIDLEPPSPTSRQPTGLAGGFQSTKEMQLYGTFSVPLLHGWLPPRDHPAYNALQRSARTHEDAENLLTREDELESKLALKGLSEEEQRILEDIGSIKYFLTSSTTQLTPYGLEKIQEGMHPGAFAILFRNNHFSTLYKHPMTGHVFSLVTDMGYAKYDEIVWESLVDTNGAGAELFSGDFRVVSHHLDSAAGSRTQSTAGDGEWTTVNRPGRKVGRKPVQITGITEPAVAVDHSGGEPTEKHVQEDADLALALQLQEEEEENHRRSSASQRNPKPAPRRTSLGQPTYYDRRTSQPHQSQGLYQPPRGRPEQLVIRTSSPVQHIAREDSSGPSPALPARPSRNSLTINSHFPVAGAASAGSPTATGVVEAGAGAVQPTQGRRSRQADPEGPGDEAPPPTYESALADAPYIPPQNSAHHHSSPVPSPSVSHFPSNAPRPGPSTVSFDELMARVELEPSRTSQGTAADVYGSPVYGQRPGQLPPRLPRRSSGAAAVGQHSNDRRDRSDKDCSVM